MNENIPVGGKIPGLTKKAFYPIETDARNVIHTEDYAQKQGLRGALVPGSTLLSYVLEMLYNYFGEKWLQHGKIKVSFIGGGAINGDLLTTHGFIKSREPKEEGAQITLEIWMENQFGRRVLVGEATCLK
jgi:hypothetical protein